MKKILSAGFVFLFLIAGVSAQLPNPTAIAFSNATASSILKGAYSPVTYNSISTEKVPDSIVKGLINKISPDSIKLYYQKLGTFFNRSTGNQLASSTQGITASIDWVNGKFQEFSAANSNRLVVSNLTFTENICSKTSHKEPLLIIPGSSLSDKSILVFTAHIDSRTDVLCPASTVESEGMEDNATGVASLMELARIMGKYSYGRTIVFLITTAEEETLSGSQALVLFCKTNGINVRANINNDQMGTMICLTPASAPGCTVNNSFDTTNIRIFSSGTINSPAKQWARYIKLSYIDKALSGAAIPMTINIMANIDRTGRSGDHVSFDDSGFVAARLMCANEAGNGSGTTTRIHSIRDLGGKDRNGDGIIDSFYVGFNYMQRNAMIDGLAMAQAANAQATPTYTITNSGNNNIKVVINTTAYPFYRIGVRTTTNDFDSVYTTSASTTNLLLPLPASGGKYYISVAGMDPSKVLTFFGTESTITSSAFTLAVNYAAFDAVKKADKSNLTFKIGSPVTGSIFYIERGTDGQNFQTIGQLNSNTGVQYYFTDSFPIAGSVNYYRIKEVDITNHISYSGIRTVKYVADDLIQIFPVPSFNSVTVVFTDALQQKPISMAMYTDLGQMVYIKNLYRTTGKEVIDVTEFRNGTYVIKITTEKGIVNKTIQVVR